MTPIGGEHDRVDVVINNAAIHYDTFQNVTDPDFDVVREASPTNVFGAWPTVLAFLPLLRKSAHARIVNVSSGAGTLTEMGGGLPAYRLSKVSLNALTRMFAAELADDHILVNSICPGRVDTDMGGSGGRPVKTAPPASYGRPPFPTTGRAAASSAIDDPYRGEAETGLATPQRRRCNAERRGADPVRHLCNSFSVNGEPGVWLSCRRRRANRWR